MTDARQLVLADLVVSYHEIRHFHRSVGGPAFFSLHRTFEAMCLGRARWADEVADRIVALGGMPQPTLAGALAAAIDAAEAADDRITVDALDAIRDGMDAYAWMLRRFAA